LPGFWHPTITPSTCALAPANVVALAKAIAVTPAMTIARPYTSLLPSSMSPPVVSAP
jgi:hypothetical protein